MTDSIGLPVPAPRLRRFGRVSWLGLWSLHQREFGRFIKGYVDNLLGPVVTSLLFFAVFRLALGGRSWSVPGIALADFVAPALVMMSIAERALSSTSASILYDKHTGALADVLMAPLTAFERVLGYALSATSTGLVIGFVVALCLWPFAHYALADLPAILLFAAGGGLLFGFLGILVGMWSTRWDHYTAAHTFVFIPTSFFSGMFLPVAVLPEIGQRLVSFNPFFYALDGMRGGLTGWREADPLLGAAVLLGCNLAAGALVWRLMARGYRIKP
ncbi:MAG TPA: ABC transporter permease [Hypericibacter adhaerens]|jgi:ABC-2 type transport system permease protein|uniref:Transport permease protein n=1 Tax=Hypericibacter adhaerens TaxID=2602016 RepID=A0A5J6MSX0_9PROT|nr:ABC transporter permease [Hypericibacter adhaerens]QEX20688.1 transport permease protein [Hypericibacter adhaerens]HWA42564.1 ABC transporter permease [Hypericibacter adhaerens]